MRIRRAVPSDWEQIAVLLRGFGRLNEAGARERFERTCAHPDHCILVAGVDQQLAGYAWAQGYGPRLRSGEESARLHDLFTLPEQRGGGIGKALFEAVKDWAQERGSRYLEWQSSENAIPFYERLGLKGEPCPQPEYPSFEIDFQATP